MGRIVSVASSMYGFNSYFCFTDFLLFLSPSIGNSHDTLQTLTYRQDSFSSIVGVIRWCDGPG